MSYELGELEQKLYDNNTDHNKRGDHWKVDLHLPDFDFDQEFDIDDSWTYTEQDAITTRKALARGLASLIREHSGAVKEMLKGTAP